MIMMMMKWNINGTGVSTSVSQAADSTSGQSSTRPSDAAVPPQANVRRTTSRLVAPRASSASKIQPSRKPIPTSVPTVSVIPPTGDASNVPSGNPSVTSYGLSSGNPSVTSSDQHVTAKSSVAVVRQLVVDAESSSTFGSAAAADGARISQGCRDVNTGSEPANESSKMPRYSSIRQVSTKLTTANRTDQSEPSVDLAPCSDVTMTSSPEVVVDSALSVAPMQPMTSRAYMTSSGNPIMTSRLLSASQRPFTPLTGTWGGRQTRLTNGYLSDNDVGLRHSGYLSEGGARRTRNLPGLPTMQQYLENVDDDDDRWEIIILL